jgi:hypothetical protein
VIVGGPGGDPDRVTQIEALLLGGRSEIELALCEIQTYVLPDVSDKLKKKYGGVIQKADWDGILNEALYELDKMCEGRRFEARGDIGGLLYRLAFWRVMSHLRIIPKIHIDLGAEPDNQPGPDFNRETEFEVLDAIESYVADLPVSTQTLLIQAVRIFIQSGAAKFSQLPLAELIEAVNNCINPTMSQKEIVRVLNKEWANLRAFFGGEGFSHER